MDVNKVTLRGYVTSEPSFQYESYGNQYYSMELTTIDSGKEDRIVFTIPERLLKRVGNIDTGAMYEVEGNIRQRRESTGRHTQFLFVHAMFATEETKQENKVEITGSVSREPMRRLDRKNRPIVTFNMRTLRYDSKYDFVHVTAFGTNAEDMAYLEEGDRIVTTGHLTIFKAKSGAELLEIHIDSWEMENAGK